MTRAFIIGNGLSRRGFDLNLLPSKGKTFGCNAIYKEFTPDILVSVDPGISREIQDSGYSLEHIHYARKPIENLGAIKVDRTAWGWSSGPIAFWYAINDPGIINIFLLGFDFVGTSQNSNDSRKHNNIYSGKEHYKKASEAATHYGNWITQLHQAMNEFKDKDYNVYHVGAYDDFIPEKLCDDAKWHELTYEAFTEMINT